MHRRSAWLLLGVLVTAGALPAACVRYPARYTKEPASPWTEGGSPPESGPWTEGGRPRESGPRTEAGLPMDLGGAKACAALGIQDLELTFDYPQNPGLIDTDYDHMRTHLHNVRWARIDIQDDLAVSRANFVHQLQRAHGNGYKVLALLGPVAGDFDSGQSFPYPLHAVNTTKLAARIDSYLAAVNAAGQTIEAFQLGTDLDSCDFNADLCSVGNASSLTPTEKATWQEGLSRLYKTGLGRIRSSAFAGATVITTGMANTGAADPARNMTDPYQALKWMESYGGTNLLAALVSNAPGFDGYGMNLRAWPNGTTDSYAQKSAQVLGQVKAAGLQITRPIWITVAAMQWETFTCTPGSSTGQCNGGGAGGLAWQGGCAPPNTCGGGRVNGKTRGTYLKAWVEWMNANAATYGQAVATFFVYDWADHARVSGSPGYSIYPCDSLGAGADECAELDAYTCS